MVDAEIALASRRAWINVWRHDPRDGRPVSAMHHLIQGSILAIVWLGCIAVGYFSPYFTDPRHDVEFAMDAYFGAIAGAVLGPFIGYAIARLVSRTRVP